MDFKVIGLTRPGFEPTGSGLEPTKFGSPIWVVQSHSEHVMACVTNLSTLGGSLTVKETPGGKEKQRVTQGRVFVCLMVCLFKDPRGTKVIYIHIYSLCFIYVLATSKIIPGWVPTCDSALLMATL